MAVTTLLIAVACALQACAVLPVIRSARLTPKLSVASPPPAGDLPFVSVVVPARNEERNIEACLLSIAAQNYPVFEIVVVDDQSVDETPAILARLAAANPRIRLIAGAELPAGWMGKPHALEQAVRHTRGSLLLFVDADVRLHRVAFEAPSRISRRHARISSPCFRALSPDHSGKTLFNPQSFSSS